MSFSDDEINEAEFRVPASDANGHNSRLWCRIQPTLERQVDIAFNSRDFPYKSKGDLVRHALTRHLQWLSGLSPFPNHLSQIEAINDILREEEDHAEFENVYSRLTVQVTRYLGEGNVAQARTLVTKVRNRILLMPEGPWKEKYLKHLDEKLGHMLSGQTVNLTKIEPDY